MQSKLEDGANTFLLKISSVHELSVAGSCNFEFCIMEEGHHGKVEKGAKCPTRASDCCLAKSAGTSFRLQMKRKAFIKVLHCLEND